MNYWSKYPDINIEMQKVEELLQKSLKSRRKVAEEASMDLLKAGGKRIRPALVIASAKFGDYESDKVVTLAAALEMFHMATLIHDDIVDNSKLRRGNETVQSKYGKDIAVYTGDYLFSKAFLLASTIDNGQKILHLSKFIKAICEGEIEQHTAKYDLNSTTVSYLKRIKYKTALLFALCCQIGSETAGCTPFITNNLRRYGMALGTAFQIRDDLLDITSDDEIVGKPVGNDILEGVYTIPLLYTLRTSPQKNEILRMLKQSHLTRLDVLEIIDHIYRGNGIAYSEALEDKHYERALKSLSKIGNNDNVNILYDLVNHMRNRVK